jgi:predicted membrane-bound spermidine synthase
MTRGRSARGLLGLVALAGACTMVVELSAVRLVAPYFGASTGVWTNVIGVVLLALSVGYLLGARLAARRRPSDTASTPVRALANAFLLSALFTAWLPAFARPVCSWFMPAGLELDRAAGLFLWGSLASTLILFLAPAVCMGCIGPLAVEVAAARRGISAGAAGGYVLCASTLGSLVGTFATTHLLLPELGVSWTLMAAAGGLAASGLLLGVSVWKGFQGLSPLLALVLTAGAAGAVWGPRASGPPLPAGLELLDRADSPYQTLRVVEDRRVEPALRLLQVNEGLDSFQSVWAPQPGLIGEGFYYDAFALPAWWSRAGGLQQTRWRVVVLGLGAGTTFRVLAGASPPELELELCGIELDAAAVELGRRWFDLGRLARTAPERAVSERVIVGHDARAALRSLGGPFDLAVLDAYAHQVEIPAHLSSIEFLREVRERLSPGGWLAINVGGFAFDDPVVAAVARTAGQAFEQPVLALRIPRSRNFVLFVRRDAAPPRPGEPHFRFDGAVGRAMLPAFALPSAWHWFAPGAGEPLTDDKNPLDQLQAQSLERARAALRHRS